MAFHDGTDDGTDDEASVYREPLPPDDRLWRHPSEVGIPASRSSRGHAWAIALGAGCVGAVVATGVIAATGGLRRDVTVIRPTAATTAAEAPRTQPPSDFEVIQIADQAKWSITQVRVKTADGPTNGSGVMLRSDGHVLTNWHLVDGAQEVTVVLANGAEHPGRIVGADRDTDIALVKVDGGPYQTANFGTASLLKIGQRAIALGSPLSPRGGPSVTVGVVSALHRPVDANDGSPLLDMIQTDSPISPGSSGGALLDGTGHVIGITSAIGLRAAGAEGFGFATPIETARMVADHLIATGRFVHVWLGVEGGDLDGATAMRLGVDGGAYIEKVIAGGPAERAGLAPRDVVVAIEGEVVTSMAALVVNLRGRAPDDVVVLEIVRDARQRDVRVSLSERPGKSS
jgi:S1-C subfamily serine protease